MGLSKAGRAALTIFALAAALGGGEAFAVAAAAWSPERALSSRALRAGIDKIVDAAAAEGFAGQLAVVRGGKLVYRRVAGSAHLAGTVPVTEDTLFHVASLTKYVTATLVLKAAEEGKIELEDSISPFVGGTSLADRRITIADLLAHRSGLGSSYAAEGHDDAAGAIVAIAEAGVDEARFGSFRYSNDGYDLLAIILEKIYGEPYEALVREKLMAKARLRHFGFWGEAAIDDPHVRGQPVAPAADELKRRNYGMIGSAGFLVTAFELAKWDDALKRGRVLSKASLHELWKPRAEVSIGQVAYGSFLVQRPLMGRAQSARGAEEWGDNAYLNDYLDCGFTVAFVTSRGPAEDQGKPLFRDQIVPAVEAVLAPFCKK